MRGFIFIFILIISFSSISCVYDADSGVWGEEDTINNEFTDANYLKIPPIRIKSNNIYRDEIGISYHSYFLFDKNNFTYWIGDINVDDGKIAILEFEELERDFDLSYIKIKSGIQADTEVRNDFARPYGIEFHFYKEIYDKENLNDDNDIESDNHNKSATNQKFELIAKESYKLKDIMDWQTLKVSNLSTDFDFVTIFVKSVYKGIKYLDKPAIAEIELLIKDKTESINNDKYDYLYKKLKQWYENNASIKSQTNNTIFYDEYYFVTKISNTQDYYRKRYLDKKSKTFYVPSFLKACELIEINDVPKKQSDYFSKLPVKFDTAKKIALKNSTSTNKKYRKTFFIYLEKPKNLLGKNIKLPLYFPFMKEISYNFVNPVFNNPIDSNLVLGKNLRHFYKKNNTKDIYIVRTHNNKVDGTVKYVLYYTIDDYNLTKAHFISGKLNETVPVIIFIFDEKGKLIKVFHEQFSEEIQYYFIYDEKNKIEKIMILEIGDFGLKRIQKAIAKK